MTKFLTFKHWQLFGLIVVLPISLLYFILGSTDPGNQLPTMLFFFPMIMIVYVRLFFGWLYSVGTNLHKRLPAAASMSLARFKIFLFIPALYFVSVSIYLSNTISNILAGEHPNTAILTFIFPVHLFSIFCTFYCIYFIAKALEAVEQQKKVTFSEYVGTLLMIGFFALGIWFIQPRINKIFAPQDEQQYIGNDM